jgi:hypothetical protein
MTKPFKIAKHEAYRLVAEWIHSFMGPL